MVLGGGPHQGRLATKAIFGVDVGAARNQQLDRGNGTALSAGQQRRRTGWGDARVCSGLQQPIDDRRPRVRTGEGQGRRAIAVGGIDVRSRVQEAASHGEIVVVDGPVQRGRPVGLGGVDRISGRNQPVDGFAIGGARSFGQPRIGRRGFQRGRRKHRRKPPEYAPWMQHLQVLPLRGTRRGVGS